MQVCRPALVSDDNSSSGVPAGLAGRGVAIDAGSGGVPLLPLEGSKVRNRPLQLLGHAPRCRLGQATAPRAPLLLPLFARVVAHCQPPTLAICSFSQGNRCRVGEVWPAIFRLLANVHAQEVVAQSGAGGKMCECSYWITNREGKQPGHADKRKSPLVRGAYRSEGRVYRRQRLASPKAYKRARKRVCSKLHTSFGRLFPLYRANGDQFPP